MVPQKCRKSAASRLRGANRIQIAVTLSDRSGMALPVMVFPASYRVINRHNYAPVYC